MMFDMENFMSPELMIAMGMAAMKGKKKENKSKLGKMMDDMEEAGNSAKYLTIIQEKGLEELDIEDFIKLTENMADTARTVRAICEKHGWDE